VTFDQSSEFYPLLGLVTSLSVPKNRSEIVTYRQELPVWITVTPPTVQRGLADPVVMIGVACNCVSLPRVLWVCADG